MPKDLARLGLLPLQTAGSVDTRVDHCALLPCGSSGPARPPLASPLDIGESRTRCNHQGVRITAHASDLIPLVRDLLRDPDDNGYLDLTLPQDQVWSGPENGDWSHAARAETGQAIRLAPSF